MDRKVILVDFDGTINSYVSGFDAERPWHLPDPPLPGAISFLRRLVLSPVYRPVIFTTRVLDAETGERDLRVCRAITEWLIEYGLDRRSAASIDVTCTKIPCALIIDDNCFRFEGSYPRVEELAHLTAKTNRGEIK